MGEWEKDVARKCSRGMILAMGVLIFVAGDKCAVGRENDGAGGKLKDSKFKAQGKIQGPISELFFSGNEGAAGRFAVSVRTGFGPCFLRLPWSFEL